MTVSELYQKCHDNYWSTERFEKSGWAREVRGLWSRHLAATFGHLETAAVGPKMIKAWHTSMVDTPTTANRALEVLSRIYRYGEEEELIPLGNPCKLVRAYTERKRSRVASEDELRLIGKELQKQKPVHYRKVLFCYLLAETGARPRSIARARRDELTLQRDGTGILRFQGKGSAESGENETVIIPARLVKALQALPVREDGCLIGVVHYRVWWDRITRDAGITGLWIRDFRRAFASVGLSDGIGIDQIGELLNHKTSQTTKTYAKLLPTARLSTAHTIASRMFHLLH